MIYKNNLINSENILTKTIYAIIILFFTIIGIYASYLYTSINNLQNTVMEMKIILNQTIYAMEQNIKLVNNIIDNDIKGMKNDISRIDKELLIIKNNNAR